MTRLSLFCATAFSLLAGAACATPLALTNVTIIDATGRAPIENGVIVMDKGRITAVGPKSSVTIPRGAEVIDKAGKYVIPGLMDANVHLFLNLDLDTLLRLRGRYADIIVEGAQLALKTGQTTVFDTWGPYPDLKAARDRINSGKDIGARIFFAGNIIGFDGPVSKDFADKYKGLLNKGTVDYLNKRWTQGTGRELLWDTADEVGKKVDTYAALDVDFLKYAANGHSDMAFAATSQRTQNAIVKAGHDAHKTVQAHVHSLEGIQSAMDAGVDILTHCDITPERTIPPELMKKMVDKGVYCSVLPTTKAHQDTLSKRAVHYQSQSMINIKNMMDAGVPLMLSTDGGITHPLPLTTPDKPVIDSRTTIGEGHYAALKGLEEINVDPMKALQAATINVAKGYKVDKDLGTLETGKYADMVVLDADPLTSARNYRAVNMVIKSGQVVDLSKLPTAPLISNQKILPDD
ncbi:MAG: amidohydrolase family protein [Alphaproteobacteria bacterium]|nr:amidohydrolase family protein [Alphaproteobacteria bacterium]MBU1513098.1 amidohydrolase family protein [Alphaproteobacteria bacterium]MBU2095206.1 amidohydrolase family protein [Alphaproteobacteria bacterium]MBU2150635.1 amidohydrolase family protein [Alphaproteobacteria bacterium]MBU2306106.1 amidohydrolase family protein [Alphaproteobacteria bacterium]